MKKILYLIPLLLGIIACGAQPQPTPNIADIVSATLTAIAQNNPEVIAPQPTFTPISILEEPTATQQAAPEMNNSILSLEILQNATYHSPDWGEYQLSNGVYYRTPPTAQESPETYTTHLLDTILYGDMNDDGIQDAVVFLNTQNGGTGHFIEMAVFLYWNGGPVNVKTEYLGDRVIVESGTVEGGLITLSLRVQGPNDPACCPSQIEERKFFYDMNN